MQLSYIENCLYLNINVQNNRYMIEQRSVEEGHLGTTHF